MMHMTASGAQAAYARGLALTAKGQHGAAISCFEQGLALAPDDARILFALGNTARDLGMADVAESFYRRVLAVEPERLEALVNLANLLRRAGHFSEAIALLEAAVDPGQPEIQLGLGIAYLQRGEPLAAEIHFRAALQARAEYVPALGNLADILADRAEFEAALELYARALKKSPQDAQLRLNRAILHLMRGDLKEGWRDYAARLQVKDKAPLCDHGLPRWNGESLKRKRLLVTAEQGVGDHVMFASVLPDLIHRAAQDGGQVILDCDPRLVDLFARSFPEISVMPQRLRTKSSGVEAQYDWLKMRGGANLAIEMGGLPRLFRKSLESFPQRTAYLQVDAMEQAKWRAALKAAGDGPYIGMCWRSGKQGGGRNLQYAPLEDWAHFIRQMPGLAVVAQYDATDDEIAALRALSGRNIFVPPALDQKQELDRAAALFASLDMIFSAPTAVSWLAAGCGVPTYKLMYDCSWTSFGTSYEPLAPQARCLMPKQQGDWADVFEQALRAIK